jgi:hypothetical protein
MTIRNHKRSTIAQGNSNLTTLVALQRAVSVLNNPGTYCICTNKCSILRILGTGVTVDDVPVADLRQIL